MNLRPIGKAIWSWTKRNAPKLLAGMAITAEAVGFYFMHKEAPVVRDRIEELGPDAKWTEKVKVAAPVYWPAVTMLVVSSGCIVAGCAMGEKRAALMASLYSASEGLVRRYEREMTENLGRDKVKEIKDKSVQEVIQEANPKNDRNSGNEIIHTTHGDEIFYDPMSGRYFTSSPDFIMNGIAKFNQIITGDMWGSINELYVIWDIPEIKLGDGIGWDSNDLYNKKGTCGLDVNVDKAIIAPNGKAGREITIYDECRTYSGNPLRMF